MHRARGNDHPVSGIQREPAIIGFECERDRTVNAVQDLRVSVAVRGVAIIGPVRPRVAATRLAAQPGHQLLGARHATDSKIARVKPRFLADCNVGRLARRLRALGYDASGRICWTATNWQRMREVFAGL